MIVDVPAKDDGSKTHSVPAELDRSGFICACLLEHPASLYGSQLAENRTAPILFGTKRKAATSRRTPRRGPVSQTSSRMFGSLRKSRWHFVDGSQTLIRRGPVWDRSVSKWLGHEMGRVRPTVIYRLTSALLPSRSLFSREIKGDGMCFVPRK